MSLQGADDLRRRLAAIQTAPDEIRRQWASVTVPLMRAHIPIRRGTTYGSVRASEVGTIIGNAPVNFIDAGVREHDITAKSGVLKFNAGGQTLFRKKVHKPRQAARPFKAAAAREGLERVDPQGTIIRLWNQAG